MSTPATKPKPKRAASAAQQKTNLRLTPVAVATLGRLKKHYGITRTFAIERAVVMYEHSLVQSGRGL